MQNQFIEIFRKAFEEGSFVKCTLSKPAAEQAREGLKNVFLRRVDLKSGPHVAFNFRYTTRDEVKNHPLSTALAILESWMGTYWLHADLFLAQDHWNLTTDKSGKMTLKKQPSTVVAPVSTHHDRPKTRFINPEAPWLHLLGITSTKGEVLAQNQHKWRQINKYIEVIDNLLKEHPLPPDAHIVDMGSGKGYLTFALYDFLLSQPQLGNVTITGIELRPNLVETTNSVAAKVGFDRLNFVAQDISTYVPARLDMLIALHACDIATDLALAAGIQKGAGIIVAAPCCHKQIRRDMHTANELAPVLEFGILEERQAEIVTDGIRALLLTSKGYGVKVFEFISTEHTAKNVMITAIRKKTTSKTAKTALEQVAAIKTGFGIKEHYLERLLDQ